MQFVKNGPDVPERLLQAHEDGRVVFFCGAGISRPAGLPGFAGLVEALYDKLSVTRDAEQQAAIKAKRSDMAIGLLENGIVGGREKVRGELPNILTPNLGASGATATHTATHDALLTLSRNREGADTARHHQLRPAVRGSDPQGRTLMSNVFRRRCCPRPRTNGMASSICTVCYRRSRPLKNWIAWSSPAAISALLI